MMPGGNEEAWPHIKDMFQDIAAKSDGEACCDWVGDEGAGHYVKMVHNGIEYGDMQLICEVRKCSLGYGKSIVELIICIGLRHHEERSWTDQQGDW
jgi:6-phosphogluconate dehydrogenase